MATAIGTIQQMYDEALKLSAEDRVRLAYMLFDSTEEEPEGWWESIEPELDAIEAAIDSGEMKTYSWEEVRQRIADKMNGKRDSLL